jgi:hypothetical protein
VVVASYDTYPGPSSGFNGAWGVYPRPDDDVVYVSDMQTGLYVLRSASAVVRYGAATAGGSGARPKIFGFGAAYLGNGAFKLQCEDAAPTSPGVMVLSGASANLNLSGLQLNVDAFTGPVLIPVATDGSGAADVPLPVPNVPALSGGRLYAQFLVFDAGGPLNLSASRGLALTVITP